MSGRTRVGGAALVLHGIPRTTIDIDIYIPAETQTVNELMDLLRNKLSLSSKLNSTDNILSNMEFLIGQWIPFTLPNGPDVLDVYCCRPGEFFEYYQSADIIDFKGSPTKIADINTLRAMKEKCGRSIDLADLALIDEYKSIIDEG